MRSTSHTGEVTGLRKGQAIRPRGREVRARMVMHPVSEETSLLPPDIMLPTPPRRMRRNTHLRARHLLIHRTATPHVRPTDVRGISSQAQVSTGTWCASARAMPPHTAAPICHSEGG